jgi:hypothetical protein
MDANKRELSWAGGTIQIAVHHGASNLACELIGNHPICVNSRLFAAIFLA